MQPVKVFDVLGEVLSSWQVIVAAIALILFFNIVFHVARSYRRPRVKRERKIRVKAAKQASEEVVIQSENDDLGLEEE